MSDRCSLLRAQQDRAQYSLCRRHFPDKSRLEGDIRRQTFLTPKGDPNENQLRMPHRSPPLCLPCTRLCAGKALLAAGQNPDSNADPHIRLQPNWFKWFATRPGSSSTSIMPDPLGTDLPGCVSGSDHGAMGLHYVNPTLVGAGEIDAASASLDL